MVTLNATSILINKVANQRHLQAGKSAIVVPETKENPTIDDQNITVFLVKQKNSA